MEDFVHLHVHTQYSILDGQSKIPHLVDKAIKDGMKGMAVTDHGVMFGIKELTDYCAKVNKDRKKEGLEPFKPIIGCEMYVARRRATSVASPQGLGSADSLSSRTLPAATFARVGSSVFLLKIFSFIYNKVCAVQPSRRKSKASSSRLRGSRLW